MNLALISVATRISSIVFPGAKLFLGMASEAVKAAYNNSFYSASDAHHQSVLHRVVVNTIKGKAVSIICEQVKKVAYKTVS